MRRPAAVRRLSPAWMIDRRDPSRRTVNSTASMRASPDHRQGEDLAERQAPGSHRRRGL